jgi:hypothetical protein
MAMDLFDSLSKHGRPSIPELVGSLREIYEGRIARAQPLAGSSRLSADQEFPHLWRFILEGITRGSEELARWLESVRSLDSDLKPDPSKYYRELRHRVERMEREARHHAEWVERLTWHLTQGQKSEGAAFYQETLYLRCQRGHRSGGRFRFENCRGRRASVTALRRPFTTRGERLTIDPGVTLQPDSFFLDARDSRVVFVEIDLAPCSNLPIGTIDSSIDLLLDETMVLKLWIEVDVYERL